MSIGTTPATLRLALALCLLLPSATRLIGAAPDQGVSPPSPAGPDAPYSFDMHFEQDGERYVMRRYVDGLRSRMEMDFDGERIVTIELGDADRTTYTVMASQKQVMKYSMGAAEAANPAMAATASPSPDLDESEPPMELIGTETIDGKAARKYEVRMQDGNGLLWLDVDTELPVRMEAYGMKVEMKNYDFSPPAAELFELPKGYDVIDMNQMMKSFSPGRMAIGGVAGSLGGRLGGDAGGSIGASIGGAFGGPLGSMVGRFIGQRIGRALGRRGGAAAVSAN
jgi:hypothetical protein